MRSQSGLPRLPLVAGTGLAAIGLSALMWSAAAIAQVTAPTQAPPLTTVPTQPAAQAPVIPASGVQPGVRPGTAGPAGSRPATAPPQDISAREASVLRGPRVDGTDGIPLGSFVLHPRLAVDLEYDDNIFRTNTNTTGDFIFRVRPSLSVDSEWDQHALQVYALGELARYASNGSESYESFAVGSRGRFDITDELALNGEAEFSRIHLPRGQPGSLGGGVTSTVHQITAGTSISYNGDPFYARIGPRFQRVMYVEGDGGVNQNYKIFEIAGRFGYRVTPELSVFIDPSYQWVRYDSTLDPFGFGRNSSGFDVRVGVAYDITRTITAEVGLGYFRRKFDDPRLAPIGGLSALARIYWNPTDTISVELEARRGVTEYRTALANGVVTNNAVNTGVQLRVGWLPLDQLLLDTGVAWNQYDYKGPGSRSDNYYTFDVGARYYVIPNVFVGPRYIHERRNSDTAGFNYRDNRYVLTLGGQL